MSETTPSTLPRRWFSFSLRTMFVVMTVFAVWLGWEMRYIHQRKELRRRPVTVTTTQEIAEAIATQGLTPKYQQPMIPFWRRWLGDVGIARLQPEDRETTLAAIALFPEAEISVRGQVVQYSPARKYLLDAVPMKLSDVVYPEADPGRAPRTTH